MKRISSTSMVFLITISATLFYQAVLSHTQVFMNYRLKSIDTLYSLHASVNKPLGHIKDIVVINADDDSYRLLNRAWPWDRSVFAVFLDNLQKLSPKTVGFDYTFVGNSQDPSVDKWFAESIKKNRNVVLASYFDQSNRLIAPLDIFLEAALSHGFIDKPYDDDAVNRRTQSMMTLTTSNKKVFSFGTLLAYAYMDLDASKYLDHKGDHLQWSLPESAGSKRFTSINVKLDIHGNRWLSYRYRSFSFRLIPFWKIVMNKIRPEELKGKLVLVGTVSPLFHDIHPTPLGLMPGTLIVANEILSILDKDFIEQVPPYSEWLLWLILTLIFTFIFYRLDFIKSLLILVLSEIIIFQSAFALFSVKNLIFEPFSPMITVALCYFITTFYRSLGTFLENMSLQKMVVTDSLTGLYGHRYLSLRLETEYNRYRDIKSNFCFTMIDVDLFKKVNDTYGHEVGNTVLISIAKLLKNGIRGYDLAARYGGEEFSLMLFRMDEAIAYQMIERIRLSVSTQKIYSPKGEFNVTISAGICSSQNPSVQSKDDLVRFADQALYQAKSKGRNQTVIYKAAVVHS